MRIIAGLYKGRNLKSPPSMNVRPTSDRLRETLFNVLGASIVDARVLDGYAGTGAVGIEALSRGAAHVTFADHDPRAIALIEANLKRCGVTDRYAIIRAGFADATARFRPPAFDIIFLDPPYGAAELTKALDTAGSLMQPGTLLVLEHARRDVAPAIHEGLTRTRVLTSGDSALAFYRLSLAGEER
jgi:16S rRNA (guanine966-N2)-methyltransferase